MDIGHAGPGYFLLFLSALRGAIFWAKPEAQPVNKDMLAGWQRLPVAGSTSTGRDSAEAGAQESITQTDEG